LRWRIILLFKELREGIERALPIALFSVCVIGCGNTPPECPSGCAPDAGVDAHGLFDAAPPGDGGVEQSDVGVDATSLADSGLDAPPDRDSDGTPDDVDCDADDGSVGRTAERPCMGFCGDGVERCTDGRWVECADLDSSCRCDTAGEFREVVCGMCGTEPQRCMEGRWTPTTACRGEGECMAGTRRVVYSDACGDRLRVCTDVCRWTTEVVGHPGYCNPGDIQCDFGGEDICTDYCLWAEAPEGTCP
jgi:hypothetical protein